MSVDKAMNKTHGYIPQFDAAVDDQSTIFLSAPYSLSFLCDRLRKRRLS